jgi:hypothetical protein
MSDDTKSKSTVIKLVAIERGFLNGRMVEPGRTFQFDTVGADGKPRKLPKWAAATAEDGEVKSSKARPKAGDLRPADAQAAVKAKQESLTNGLV